MPAIYFNCRMFISHIPNKIGQVNLKKAKLNVTIKIL